MFGPMCFFAFLSVRQSMKKQTVVIGDASSWTVSFVTLMNFSAPGAVIYIYIHINLHMYMYIHYFSFYGKHI